MKSIHLRFHCDNFMPARFCSVTEMPGDPVSQEQIARLCHRYLWAGQYCRDRDVLEAGCGPGLGLGHLARQARSLQAGDYDDEIIGKARAHYGQKIPLHTFDAQALPFADRSLDVVILFEALYYLPDAERFIREAHRVLRPRGWVLVSTANKDLYDFVPSPASVRYFGVPELTLLFGDHGFSTSFYGYMPVELVSLRQRLLRPAKALAARAGLMPKTMAGKRLLKRIVFGQLVPLPPEIHDGMIAYVPPTPVAAERPDKCHKVIYCAARRIELASNTRL